MFNAHTISCILAVYNFFRGTIFTCCFILDHEQVLCGSVLYTWKILTSQLTGTIQLFEHISMTDVKHSHLLVRKDFSKSVIILQTYIRYQVSKLYLCLLQHLGFVHCPIREHCPAYPQCTDCLVERSLQRRTAGRPADTDHLNIILLGQLQSVSNTQCADRYDEGWVIFYLKFS